MKSSVGLLAAVAVASAVVLGTAMAQRGEFQRQKFDRSRFSRAGAAVAEPEPEAAPAPAEPAPSAAAPMPTSAEGGWGAGNSGAPQQGARVGPDGRLSTGVPAALVEAPRFDLVPKKWFTKAGDWEELKGLQKETGACILVAFKNPSDSGQKGLCNWFDKESSTYTKWRKAMPYFIKLEVMLPGNSETRALAATFGFKSTPAWYVVRPDAQFPKRLPVIQYSSGGKDPNPVPERVLIPALHALCPPAYDNLF